jgi:hypothetical protein
MVDVEMIESPQHDWWVVADGRVVAVYLSEEEERDMAAFNAAHEHGDRLRGEFGMSILNLGTTWRSRAFDHLEDLSCRRSTCCKFIPRYGPADWGDEGEEDLR